MRIFHFIAIGKTTGLCYVICDVQSVPSLLAVGIIQWNLSIVVTVSCSHLSIPATNSSPNQQ